MEDENIPIRTLKIVADNNRGTHIGINHGSVNTFQTDGSVEHLREDIEKRNLTQDERACLQALFPSGIKYEDQKNQNPPRVPGTCLWALHHQQYQQWRNASTGQLLWISADAGCGKSVLSRSIIDEDLEDFRSAGGITVYYFFKDTSEEQRSASRALASMLHQLFECRPSLIRFALPKFLKRGKEIANSLSDLWSIFVDAVTASEMNQEKAVCLLDALDECYDNDSKELVKLIDEFRKRQKSSNTLLLKFLITSRPYLSLKAVFTPLIRAGLSIQLDGNAESNDIQKEIDLVIRHRVQALGDGDIIPSATIPYLQQTLLEMKQRTYLWLRLIWELMTEHWPDNTDEIKTLINNLPRGIIQTYGRLLSLCPDKAFARKVLQIVLVARRPLTVDEMDIALHIGEKSVSIDHLKLTGSSRLAAILPGKCGHIVSIVNTQVYFIHQTVKEFLVEGHSNSFEPIDEISSHNLLGSVCLRRLSFQAVDQKTCNVSCALLPPHSRILEEDLPRHSEMSSALQSPFLSYTAIYWADHFKMGKMKTQSVEKLIGKQVDLYGRYEIKWSLLQGAAIGGHFQIVQLLLDRGSDVNAQGGGDYENALQGAAVHGHLDMVQLLLDRGADINAQGGDYGNALQGAVVQGRLDMVQLLLDRGADINAQGGDYGNALQGAVVQGRLDMVQLLLDRGADYGNALQGAAVHGHLDMVQLLLDRGADINAQGGDYGNALQGAAVHGHLDMVQLLLDRGADINAQGGDYGNALQGAVVQGRLDMVQLLLDRGADYGNALQGAAEQGYLDVVQLLLDRGADVNAHRGGHYRNVNALQGAAEKGHLDVVQLLLDRGADINAQGGGYNINVNALQGAAEKGHLDVVQLLLDRGADINAQGGAYGNTINALATHCDVQVFHKILYNPSTKLHPDSQGRTLLHVAARYGKIQTLDYVLLQGLDITEKDATGKSVLHYAVSSGSIDMVRRILEDNKPQDYSSSYWSVIHWAYRTGDPALISILKDAGIDNGENVATNDPPHAWSPEDIGYYHQNTNLLEPKPSRTPTQGREFDIETPSRIRPISLITPRSGSSHPGQKYIIYLCSGCFLVGLTNRIISLVRVLTSRKDIYGPRFACTTCNDFDYCFMCYATAHLGHPGHAFQKYEDHPR